jgi:hypothetical protein
MAREATNKLYTSGLAELETLDQAERVALGRRLTPEQVERERLDVIEDFVAMILRDLHKTAPRDVVENLELMQLCLYEIRVALRRRRHTQPLVAPRAKRKRTKQAQCAGQDFGAMVEEAEAAV